MTMDAPFDRGEVDRASLDATERLRARLSGRPIAAPQPRQRRILPWALAGGLFIFAAGMIANPWFERNVRTSLPFAEATTADDNSVKALTDRLAQVEKRSRSATAPMPSERLARTEAQIETSTDQIAHEAERIDRMTADVAALSASIAADKARGEAATATAIAAADRAQAMLTLVLVRRAVDAGRPLGPLDAVLRQSFEARYPQAVQSVSALGSAPVTLMSLRRDFNALRPAIGARPAAGTRQDWWQTLTTTVRDAVSRPTEANQAPPEAAATALARNDVAAAAAQLRRMTGSRPLAVTNWIAAADRLLAGNAGLATLETAAVLAPVTATAAKPPSNL
nr:hypothetical protein [Polymorphobacter sp.]